MRGPVRSTYKRYNDTWARTADKAYRRLTRDMEELLPIIYGAAGIALHELYGYGAEHIEKIYESAYEVWDEVGGDKQKSAVQLLEEETGLELQCGNGKSWTELAYLNEQLWCGAMTPDKAIYMRNRQKDWNAILIISCILIALHRREGFGARVRLQAVLQRTDEIRREFKTGKQALKELRKRTGVVLEVK